MRSIGAKNIRLVKETARSFLMKKGDSGLRTLEDEVVSALPISLWDTWECADSQIRNIIHDTLVERV